MTKLETLKKQWRPKTSRDRKRAERLRRLWPLLVLLLVVAGVGGWLQQRGAGPAAEIGRADQALIQGDAEAALSHLQRVYRRYPEAPQAPQALYRAGRLLHRQLHHYREAILLLLQLEDRYPDASQVLPAQQEIGEIYKYRLQDYARAISTYQRLMDAAPADGDRYQYEIADSYFLLGNYEQSRIEFEQLLKRWPQTPRNAEVRLRIGRLYRLEGKDAKAEAVFRRLLTERPDEPSSLEAQLALAGLYEDRGELHQALKLLKELNGRYQPQDLLQQRIEQVRRRLKKRGLD